MPSQSTIWRSFSEQSKLVLPLINKSIFTGLACIIALSAQSEKKYESIGPSQARGYTLI